MAVKKAGEASEAQDLAATRVPEVPMSKEEQAALQQARADLGNLRDQTRGVLEAQPKVRITARLPEGQSGRGTDGGRSMVVKINTLPVNVPVGKSVLVPMSVAKVLEQAGLLDGEIEAADAAPAEVSI